MFHGVINVYTHMDIWRITLKKRNTYGVEFFILCHNSYFLALEYMVDCAEKAQHLWR